MTAVRVNEGDALALASESGLMLATSASSAITVDRDRLGFAGLAERRRPHRASRADARGEAGRVRRCGLLQRLAGELEAVAEIAADRVRAIADRIDRARVARTVAR